MSAGRQRRIRYMIWRVSNAKGQPTPEDACPEFWRTAPTCPTTGSIAPTSAKPSAAAAERALARSRRTTRTRRLWASKRHGSRSRVCPSRPPCEQLYFATATPALPRQDERHRAARRVAARPARARGGHGRLRPLRRRRLSRRDAQALRPTLVVLSDVRTGLPGGADERDGGDGAAAFVVGPESAELPVLAELVASASATEEFLDRWRIPGDVASRTWEERFGEEVYLPLAAAAFADAVKQADLTPDTGRSPDRRRAGDPCREGCSQADRGATPRRSSTTLPRAVGNTGTAHPGLLLADVLDRAQPGQTIVVLTLADGATATVFRTTDALPARRSAQARGRADRCRPTRPAVRDVPDLARAARPRAAAPTGPRSSVRRAGLPAARVEVRLRRVEVRRLRHPASAARPGLPAAVTPSTTCSPEPMADVPGTLATYTVDRLAYSLQPAVAVRRRRLRRRRPIPLRAHRRSARRGGDRPAGRDDVSQARDRRRDPQLLLEGEAGPRQPPASGEAGGN